MHKAARLFQEANGILNEVDEYLENNGISDKIYRCGNGISLEEIEAGNDITEEFVAWAENDFNLSPQNNKNERRKL